MGGHLCAKGCHMEVGGVRLICLVFFYCYGCMLTEKYYGLHLTGNTESKTMLYRFQNA